MQYYCYWMHQIWEHYVKLEDIWQFLFPKGIEYTSNLSASYLEKHE